ncbi:gamma-glutamyltransferase family protein [Sphingomonas koreensis]|jgi:gamma-glutamyltranspeptidase/glutathione hydrolase|uniref:Gamma-glutamyltransferase family protein n=2 Tax=Sphingomonas koreensis TaxID=93064 RepID=A0AAJ4S283_9SPHN|nr:gamma-glutamyltransferase family protein [Sphingomonas koreensis]MDC7809373.1 gamma-glutamyltransferase family protein [Sphingomonas koreensis]RSU18442.1 gamma-glutamyltransferase family protein [Sphingomonas koreensis]RSU22507.1 gamma-glutamyltransferase family protein [Sphingomonas koreensis]RSU23886.1 gamma-glutamyltransferase family protein [Sphingomonas koreensis]RSU33260.1 gamma-glutamyltransferase family protein [Sphingomonas koreensis]
MNLPMNPLLAAFALASLAACAPRAALPPATAPAPVAPAATPAKERQAFVAAAHPLAVEAGLEVLRKGGSAVDAAVAVQAMLSLVEPQSSGLGGGAFMVRYDAKTKGITVYNGRETAPAGATPDMLLGPDGKPLSFFTAVVSGRATGVPGVVRMLALAQERHGNLAWKDLFGDVIRTADQGFTVTERLAGMIASRAPQARGADAVAYFRNERGEQIRAGDTLRNPAYAAFVRRLAAQGPDAMYKGETARRIVARLREGEFASTMTEADIAGYKPEVRDAVCNPYRVYILCAPPPPSSGVGLLQLMAMIERTDIGTRGPNDPVAWVKYAEASRVMYADRDAYVGDVPTVPVKGMLDPAYVASRAALVGDRAGPAPQPGTPPGAVTARIDATNEVAGTSHFIVIDGEGNAVSMTTTVESLFGSGRMVDGFFLNNQMTDFSFVPEGPNAIAPGKRPRSSMVPTIILNPDRSLAGAIGSPGGNAILAYVSKALLGIVEWNMPVADAIALPNLVARGSSFNGEESKFAPPILAGMAERGVVVRGGSGENSGLHGVMLRNGGFDGGADPRRDGVARSITLPPKK